MTELSKGNEIALRLALKMLGITPEMLANPALILAKFGINPDLVLNKVAEFQQIGVSARDAIIAVNFRLARIEAHLGIITPDQPGDRIGADDDDGGKLGSLEQRPPDRRN